MKILVAMSGGVDSSVVAHLLKREGHEIIGLQFSLWSDPLAPALAQILPNKCCNAETIARAKKVAEDLTIPFHRIDLSEEFKREVVDPFLEGFAKGLTPNPCIRCNRTIKFGKLLEIAKDFGCERLATGHYARVARESGSGSGSEKYVLLEAIDKSKDQSYFLYGLSQEQLSKVLFPLGSLLKSEVFALAREFGVPLPEYYQESQDLCFFPEKTPHAFIDRYLHPEKGEIVDTEGMKHGMHDGLPHYTEGQRHGLKIGGLKIPLHVVSKDLATNRLIVGKKEEAERMELQAHSLRWIAYTPSKATEHDFDARIHSLGIRHRGKLTHDGETLRFRFSVPVLGISPGQSIVLTEEKRLSEGALSAILIRLLESNPTNA